MEADGQTDEKLGVDIGCWVLFFEPLIVKQRLKYVFSCANGTVRDYSIAECPQTNASRATQIDTPSYG